MKIFHVDTAKEAYGTPFGGEVGWLLFFTMWERLCRRQYAHERQNPEQFDLGGES